MYLVVIIASYELSILTSSIRKYLLFFKTTCEPFDFIEWDGTSEFPEDAVLLRKVLEKLLTENPEDCKKLIGTGIIEEDYFDELRSQ